MSGYCLLRSRLSVQGPQLHVLNRIAIFIPFKVQVIGHSRWRGSKGENIEKRYEEAGFPWPHFLINEFLNMSKLQVVGIGASAGGLKAIEELLHSLPAKTGVAFVIVQHISIKYKSLMKDILAKDTRMPVEVVSDGMALEPNNIYLIPAGSKMTVKEGHFTLEDLPTKSSPSYVIDSFFESLAKEYGDRGVAVVLSGTGTDGSRGIAKVKKAGGIVIAQEPNSSEFDGMPQSAIDTNLVDVVLPPYLIGEQLGKLSKAKDSEARQEQIQELVSNEQSNSVGTSFSHVIRLLKQHHGIDFTFYKVATIQRRIQKHMALQHKTNSRQYYDFLVQNPDKLEELFNDLLIGVTEFFRDPEAYSSIGEEVLPRLMPAGSKVRELRIWVCGCSTGEEAISVAIAIRDYAERNELSVSPTILATDVDADALAHAGRARYKPERVKGIPPHLREKYLDFNGEEYEVKSIIRDHIIYARNDVTIDPPFINLDLVICRNLLIYLNPPAQRRVLLNFHFGLKEEGVLWLGSSENILDFRSSFKVLDEKWKIFQSRGETPRIRKYYSIERLQDFAREQSEKKEQLPNPLGVRNPRVIYTNLLIERFAPTSILIDEEFSLLYLTGGAGKYLNVPDMEVSKNVLAMISEPAVFAIRDGVRRLFDNPGPFTYPNLDLAVGGVTVPTTLTIERASKRAEKKLFLIQLTDQEAELSAKSEDTGGGIIKTVLAEANAYEIIRELQGELNIARQEVQNSLEELETSNEELQAANEELLAGNEELQSTNEELQSVNEELYTVNSELQARNKELSQVSSIIENIYNGTPIGIAMVGKKFHVRQFNHSFADIADLGEEDIGIPLNKFHLKWDYPEFFDDLANVINTGKGLEKEVFNPSVNQYYLVYLTPFRWEGKVDGAIISKVRITDRVKAERALKSSEGNLQQVIKNVPFVISILDVEGKILDINFVEGGYNKENVIGTNFFAYHKEDKLDGIKAAFEACLEYREPQVFETQPDDLQGNPIRYRNTIMPFFGSKGVDTPTFVVSSVNITPEKEHISKLQNELNLFSQLVNQHSHLITLKDERLQYVFVSDGFLHYTHKSRHHVLGNNDLGLFPRIIGTQLRTNDEKVLSTHRPMGIVEKYMERNDGKKIVAIKFPVKLGDEGNYIGMVGVPFDLDVQALASTGLEDLAKLESLVDSRTHALSQANLELRTITRSMAHDLRAPLRAIHTFGQLLEEGQGGDEPEEHQLYLRRIIHQSARMGKILEGLLAYVKLGSMEIKKDWMDVASLARSVWEELKEEPRFERGQLTVRKIPETWADKSLIYQVLANLFSNALKYTASGTEPQVEFGSYQENKTSELTFYVKDNGIGFEPTETGRVFQIFERLGNAAEQEGYGLGLSIVKRAIELQGGRVWVTSRVGIGSTFYFSLPVKK